jgi:protein SCO1/2
MVRAVILSLAVLLPALPARADTQLPASLQGVGFDQKLGAQVPLDLSFRDETGQVVRLGDYFGDKPVILVLVQYRCPMLCTEVLNGLVRSLLGVSLEPGRDFSIVTVSFDTRETPELAAAKKKTYVERYGRPGAEAAWHFLTGDKEPVSRLTEAVGFRYRYDAKQDRFAHASGIMILTPDGKVSRYFYDISYPSRDVRLGLVEASNNRIGSPVDQVLLFCFHYDPTEGKYGAAVMNFVRLGGVLTILGLGGFVGLLWRGERRRARQSKFRGGS